MSAALPPKSIRHSAFTVRYTARSLTLVSDVEIFPAFASGSPMPQGRKYRALYDTGATNSAVSPRVVSELNLASTGAMNVGVGGGNHATTSHIVNIALPNRVMFQMIQVVKLELPHGDIDVLIGMDILGEGDFSVTHHRRMTTFSFCVPTRREIDFVKDVDGDAKVVQVVSPPRPGRNSMCGCNSGKKYKHCCGRT